ncbi:hypothetical protein C8A01DRAFT_39163 [Parachaetomium inaequale]|uniref:Uncharacterized protein n=1 Tax=Parachaetomium inaequale TaxID=2588326 RepID=A0AAN6P9R4_9PEZI|nr:hypothetical protein C8A01DRAFT_39163 [Parachaetomium inaequale]
MDNLSHDSNMSDDEEQNLPQTPTARELDHIGMTAEQWRSENPRPSGPAPTVPTFPTAPIKTVSRSKLEAKYEALKRKRLQHRIDAPEKERQSEQQDAEIQLEAASLMVEGRISQLKNVVDENEENRKKESSKDRVEVKKLGASVEYLQETDLNEIRNENARLRVTQHESSHAEVVEATNNQVTQQGLKNAEVAEAINDQAVAFNKLVEIFNNDTLFLNNKIEALEKVVDSLRAEVARLTLASTSTNETH